MNIRDCSVVGLLLLTSGLCVSTPVQAQEEGRQYERRENLRERFSQMSPEQRQQMRQQMREHWQQMPPEQRESRRQELRERWQNAPPEERQRWRENRQRPNNGQSGAGQDRQFGGERPAGGRRPRG